MGCESGMSKDVVSNCTTQQTAGIEVKVWAGNRSEFGYTLDTVTPSPSKITSVDMAVGARLWTIEGVKKLIHAGTELQLKEDRSNQYLQKLIMQFFESKAADVENMDAMEDMVFIVEMKSKSDDGDGVFRAYGVTKGLYKSTLTQDTNDIDSATAVEFGNQTDEYEKFPWWTVHDTDYATTLAMLVAQETIQT